MRLVTGSISSMSVPLSSRTRTASRPFIKLRVGQLSYRVADCSIGDPRFIGDEPSVIMVLTAARHIVILLV